MHLQGNVSRRFNLIANYTLASAKTWGCVLGELFDYVNGVCNPPESVCPRRLRTFRRRRSPSLRACRNVLRSGRLRTDHSFASRKRAAIHADDSGGREWFRGSRPTIAPSSTACRLHSTNFAGLRTFRLICASAARSASDDRWTATPFIEFFNLFNRNNPGSELRHRYFRASSSGEQPGQCHRSVPHGPLAACPSRASTSCAFLPGRLEISSVQGRRWEFRLRRR